MKRAHQKGQAVIEAILILALLLGLSRVVANYFKSNEVLKQLVSGPWQSLSSMIQNGVWDPKGPNNSKAVHPNQHDRHISVLGDD